MISCGKQHSVFISDKNEVYSCGSNKKGQLGIGHKKNKEEPDRMMFTDRGKEKKLIIQVACGSTTTYLLTNKGKVYSCGSNDHGELGLGKGDEKAHPDPRIVPLVEKVEKIAAGYHHVLFLMNQQYVRACGSGEYGQLGLGQRDSVGVPSKINMNDVIDISCGSQHSVLLKKDGIPYSMGYNRNGQLGVGDYKNYTLPTEVKLKNIIQVAGGNVHTIFLTKNYSLYVCGYNLYGQLGLGEDTKSKPSPVPLKMTERVNRLISSPFHCNSFCISEKGNAYSWGHGRNGQLGHNDREPYGKPKLVESLSGKQVVFIASGEKHSLFAISKRMVYSCGENQSDQLGLANGGLSEAQPTIINDLPKIYIPKEYKPKKLSLPTSIPKPKPSLPKKSKVPDKMKSRPLPQPKKKVPSGPPRKPLPQRKRKGIFNSSSTNNFENEVKNLVEDTETLPE